jgi:hypothetical protein
MGGTEDEQEADAPISVLTVDKAKNAPASLGVVLLLGGLLGAPVIYLLQQHFETAKELHDLRMRVELLETPKTQVTGKAIAPPDVTVVPHPTAALAPLKAKVVFDSADQVFRARFDPDSPRWIELVALGRKAGYFTLSIAGGVSLGSCDCSHPMHSPTYTCTVEPGEKNRLIVQTFFNSKPSNEPFALQCTAT